MKVIKRDDTAVDFDLQKIKDAIRKAFESIGKKYDESIIDLLSLQVNNLLFNKHIEDISVEEIQDEIERVLQICGYTDVAKSFILYRDNHSRLREAKKNALNYKKLVDSYLNVSDWRVKENSTVSYSLGGLILSNSGAITANYWLNEIYDNEISEAHKNADIHIHDLSMLSGYCFTGDTRVKTLDGKNPTFKELVDNNVDELWVYAYDKDEQKIVPTKAINPRVTRVADELIEITLSDKTTIRCTPDHRFMLRDGSYTEARNLKANMSLMPLYISENSKYCSIHKSWTSDNKKCYLHRWVMENMLNRPLYDDEVVHHKNGDKHDNRPENLIVMNDKEHRSMEVLNTMHTDVWKTANKKRLVEYNKSEEKRLSISEKAKNAVRDANGRFISTFKYHEEYDINKAAYNHRIRKVKLIKLDEAVETYDLTVPKYENFAIAGNVFVHNCAGWSLKQLIQEGLGGVSGRITSAPAKHLGTLCNQMVNFLGILQNEWAGAQAFSSFDTYLAPFVKVDNLTYEETEKCIESFVYGMNTPSRWGTQAPFSNITLDWTVPEDLKNLPAIVGGKEMSFTYGDCKKEMDMINKAFINVMIRGDANGRGFQYPIPTYSITKDFDWSDTENNRLLFEMTAKYGTPYFSNYVNSDMEPSDIRSMCCRLRLDLRELRKKSGGFFGSGESTGSVGVVTINMPRIAYLSEDENEFYTRLDRLMNIAARSLKVKRNVISKFLEEGLYPYTKRYLGTFKNHFSTIGLVGMNEACLNANWIKADLTHEKAQRFTEDVLNHMREKLSDYQELYGDLYNLEATPAESTSYRLAKHDVEKYPDIITASMGGNTPYYTNSSHLPVGYTDDIFSALDIQDKLQTLYTSGTVFHAFIGEKLPSWESAAAIVRKIAENYKLPYYTLSPTYSVCTKHGYIVGEHFKCPVCGQPTEVYSRITGYYRPVQNWNDGKTQEYKDRKLYDIARSVLNKESKEMVKESEKITTNKLDDGIYLFTTKTCPNCRIVKVLLEQKNISYINIDAEENPELTTSLNIMQAPTLVIVNKGQVETYSNASNIRAYLMSRKN